MTKVTDYETQSQAIQLAGTVTIVTKTRHPIVQGGMSPGEQIDSILRMSQGFVTHISLDFPDDE